MGRSHGRIHDLALRIVDDGEGSKALVVAELAAPAAGDGEIANGDGAAGRSGGGRRAGRLDGVLDGGGGAGAVVDAEGPVARRVGGVDGAR